MHWKRLMSAGLLACMLITVVGCSSDTTQTGTSKGKAKTEQSATTQDGANLVKRTLYVPRENGSGLQPMTIEVAKNRATPKAAVLAVMDADRKHKYPIFTKGMGVDSVTVKDGIATVEVNSAFVKGNGGDLTTQLQIGAIVNTLTAFPDIKGVLFALKGKKVETIGNFDTSSPLTTMQSLNK